MSARVRLTGPQEAQLRRLAQEPRSPRGSELRTTRSLWRLRLAQPTFGGDVGQPPSFAITEEGEAWLAAALVSPTNQEAGHE